MSTVEQRVAETLLQEKKAIVIGGVEYNVTPPTIATLAKVSALISEMPQESLNEEKVLSETLRVASKCSKIQADVLAVIILGVNKPENRLPILKGRRKYEKLSKKFYYSLSPEEIRLALMNLMSKHLQVGDFFGLTAFLVNVGVTKPTREAETTPSGQQ